MDYFSKSAEKRADRVNEPLAGGEVLDATQPGRTDLSDWIELMEAVEALCPVWPTEGRREGGRYRL